MGLLKRLFAGPDTAGKLVEAGISGIDAAWWTQEEKSRWVLQYMEATQAQNLSRRLISLVLVSVFSFLLLASAVAWPLFEGAWSRFIMAEVIGVHLSSIVGLVIAFYFGHGLIRTGKGK